MDARVHVLISGVVQGVCFRAFVRDKAADLKVKGWVKNRNDGKVEGVFEGSRYAILELLEMCSRGPSGASVDDVKTEWLDFEDEFDSFSVRY